MIELLALPAWNSPPRTLDDWVTGLAGSGHTPVVERVSGSASWLEVAPLRLRGYAVLEGAHVEAINFELADPDPGPAAEIVEAAAKALGWEVYPDEADGEDDLDED
jgi:hypothetical protein